MINNIKRALTMLGKAQNRLARQCYYDPKQYPEIFLEIEKCINAIRSWINEREMFQSLQYFYATLSALIDELGGLISQLWDICKPRKGKKSIPKTQRDRQKIRIFYSIRLMINNITQKLNNVKSHDSTISIAFEIGMLKSFDKSIIENVKKKMEDLVSKRGNQTYIFPCNNTESYHALVKDNKKFCIEVLDKLDKYDHHTGHNSTCSGPKEYMYPMHSPSGKFGARMP